jgi:hypothetical protein
VGKGEEKVNSGSPRVAYSAIIAVLIVTVVLGASSIINRGPILPLFGIVSNGVHATNPGPLAPAVVVEVACSPANTTFACLYPYFNYSTGVFTVAISQKSGYNWTSVTVLFVPAGAQYSHGVPVLSWAPPRAVNVTGGLLNGTIRYINIPIGSGPVAVGTNITGSIWAKYQVTLASTAHYVNMSSAVIVVKR